MKASMKSQLDSGLPSSWLDVTLGEVIDYGATEKAEPEEILNDAWILELEDIQKQTSKLIKKEYFSERQPKSTKNRFMKGDVLYGKLRPYLDKVIIADDDGFCTTEIIPLKPGKLLNDRYLFYSLKRKEFLEYVSEVSHGLNMPRLGTKQGKSAPFKLAPLNEQTRIANKLDNLLAKVDAAQARLEKILVLLKRFRQSVLTAATSGELTREWRNTNNISFHDWKVARLSELAVSIRSGSGDKPSGHSEGIPVLRSSAVRDMKINFSDVRYFAKDKEISPCDSLKNGDLLFTRLSGSPEYVGNCAAVFGLPHTVVQYPDRLFCVKLKDLRSALYLEIFFSSMQFKSYISQHIKSSAGHQRITLEPIKNAEVNIPSITEQKEIVRRVESLFALADVVEKQYHEAKRRVDRLTQSLLSKAFRGELVPQDPNDEPATELLKHIQAEREAQSACKPSRKKATRKHVVKAKK